MANTEELGNYFESLSSEEKAVRDTTFFSILEGLPSSISHLKEETNLQMPLLKNVIHELEAKGIIVVEETTGNIVGSFGLSLVETPHQLKVNGRHLYTWCAADTIGIPAALGMDAMVKSYCFTCRKPLTIDIAKGKVVSASEQNIRLWVVEADLGKSVAGCT